MTQSRRRRGSQASSCAKRRRWRATGARTASLRDYLVRHNIVAIADIDTRALTRVLRSAGVMRGVIATGQVDPEELVEKARAIPKMEGSDLVRGVTCDAPFEWRERSAIAGEADHREFGIAPQRRASRRLRVAAYDFGIKWNILRRLDAYGCDVRVFPGDRARERPARDRTGRHLPQQRPWRPRGAALRDQQRARAGEVRTCRCSASVSGTRFSASRSGGQTFKLKFGHRGANHPVKELDSGKVEITSQNHGFAVDPDSLPADVKVTHLNLYDGTVEGFCHTTKPIFSVQYHPEASPGPHDADYLFLHSSTRWKSADAGTNA